MELKPDSRASVRWDGGLASLQTERLILRAAFEADIPALIAYHRENFDRLKLWSSSMDERRFTEEYWREQLPKSAEGMRLDSEYRFYLFEKGSGLLIGIVSLNDVTRTTMQFCSVGYNIASSHEGRGLMSEAVGAVVHFAFRHLDLHRLEAYFQPNNQRSANVLKRHGFEVEGTLRECVLIDGTWRDHLLVSLMNPSWKGLYLEAGKNPAGEKNEN